MTDAAAIMIDRAKTILEREFRGSPPKCTITLAKLSEGIDLDSGDVTDVLKHFQQSATPPKADWDVNFRYHGMGHIFEFSTKTGL